MVKCESFKLSSMLGDCSTLKHKTTTYSKEYLENQMKAPDKNEGNFSNVLNANGIEEKDLKLLTTDVDEDGKFSETGGNKKWEFLFSVPDTLDEFSSLNIEKLEKDAEDNNESRRDTTENLSEEENVLKSELLLDKVCSNDMLLSHLSVDKINYDTNILHVRLRRLNRIKGRKKIRLGISNDQVIKCVKFQKKVKNSSGC